MRITIAYYLLILYTVAIVKPVVPVIQDLMAHIFWNAEHISTVHHHQGDHHTDKQIAGISHDEAHKKSSPSLKISEPVSAHLAIVENYFLQYYSIKKQQYALLIYDAYLIFLGNNDPPPKGC